MMSYLMKILIKEEGYSYREVAPVVAEAFEEYMLASGKKGLYVGIRQFRAAGGAVGRREQREQHKEHRDREN